MAEPTIVETHVVTGFDPDGAPEIRAMSDGSLVIVFNFMPPSFAEEDEDRFATLEKEIEKAIGVPVFREDREVFLIRKPGKETVEKLRKFLENFKKS